MTPSEFLALHPHPYPDAPHDDREFVLRFPTMAAAWDACERRDWMFWILELHRPLSKAEAVRLAVAAARSALHLVPDGEDRPRRAIEAAEAWLADPCEATAEAARAVAIVVAGAVDEAEAHSAETRHAARVAVDIAEDAGAAWAAARGTKAGDAAVDAAEATARTAWATCWTADASFRVANAAYAACCGANAAARAVIAENTDDIFRAASGALGAREWATGFEYAEDCRFIRDLIPNPFL